MAGHSKWKNIQHRKGAQDAKRGKIFTKIGVEITVAARSGGSNPDDNARLRTALAKAKAANMPKDNWLRAIKKGTGDDSDSTQYTEKIYEGYGPGGVAVIAECLTDNVNRTVGEVRFAFSRSGGNLGTENSVSWMFERKGILLYQKNKIANFETFFDKALEAGAEDIKDEDSQIEIITTPENFMTVKTALDQFCNEPEFCELTFIPKEIVDLDVTKTEALEKLIVSLEDNDDVQNVYHNANLNDELK